MPIKDDEKRRAYFREYMRKRRAGTSVDAEYLRKLKASDAEVAEVEPPPDDELARQIKEAWEKTITLREKMDAATTEIVKHVAMLLQSFEKLAMDYDKLVDDYNELLDEIQNDDADEEDER
jgi:hypothetical protein